MHFNALYFAPIIAVCLLAAFKASPNADDRITTLCREHSGNVLIFEWRGKRYTLPVDAGISREQDLAWRSHLDLPQPSSVPGRTFSHSISAVEQFADGWLVGIDGGEWGGGLFYVQQGQPPKELVRENVVALVPTSRGVQALFGLAHLTFDYGRYRMISFAEDGPTVGAAYPLPSSPIDIAKDTSGVTFVAGGFSSRRERTWARVFGVTEPESARVYSPCK